MNKRIWKVKVDGQDEKFTRQDVRDYYNGGHGQSGLRSFGGVSGDWRMIERIAEDACAYFEMEDEV